MRPGELPTGAIASFLAESDLFGALDQDVLGRLAEAFAPVIVEAGETVIAEGDPAEALYLVHTGRLSVRRRAPGGGEHLAEVGAGQTVGELALVTDRPRSATVIASRDSRLLRLPLDAFELLVAEHPPALRALTTQVVAHLERDRPAGTRLSVITVVPMHRSDRVRRAVGELTAALRDTVAGAGVLRPVGDAGNRPFRIHQLEQSYELVVAVATGQSGRWTASCVNQADRVVLVADADHDPGPVPVEEQVAARVGVVPVRVELVLAHPPTRTSPVGTAAWLENRKVARHHHLRVGDLDHARRVARLVSDRGVGLVCSGGGARAMAEIGVLRALEASEVDVDAVTGTSAGAIVGGSHTLGWSAERVRRTLRRHLVESSRPVEPTVPMVSLSSGARMAARLRAVCGDRHIEDSWIDFGCVSTNLSTLERVIHRSGPMWRALRASASIPGVFPPVAHDHDLLVDGGVIDNLPIGPLLDRHPGVQVIAVDVGARRDLNAGDLPDDTVVRGWSVLRDRLHPGRPAPRIAGIASVMARLAELGKRDDEHRFDADLLIRPEVDDVPLLDFGRFDDVVDRGYREGMATLVPFSRRARG